MHNLGTVVMYLGLVYKAPVMSQILGLHREYICSNTLAICGTISEKGSILIQRIRKIKYDIMSKNTNLLLT